MSVNKIDGVLLDKMLRNGLNALRLKEAEINKLNVFPVPDGDTGTNMRLTLENGLSEVSEISETGKYLRSLSNGMLFGARGNSGVIFSQIIKGLYIALSRTVTIRGCDLRAGFISGYRAAYDAVERPVEGTILTVAREGIENIRTHIGRNTPVDVMLSMYVAEMRKVVATTPDMLESLKVAGVVDSGAVGYITVVEGMLKYLYGEIIEESSDIASFEKSDNTVDLSVFNENSSFEDGYCMEFLLQRINQPGYLKNYNTDEFKLNLSLYGNSIVTADDGTRVKVHIHTKDPSKIISYVRQYGEFVSFKLENMQIQHNSRDEARRQEKKKLCTVAVADGKGVIDLLKGLGCDAVIEGGATMNPSSKDFVNVIESLSAEDIVIFPNNKNSFGVANQAVKLYKGEAKITVIPTSDVTEAYFALALDVADSDDNEYRINQMRQGANSSATLSISVASKPYKDDKVSIAKGEYIAFLEGNIVFGSKDFYTAITEGLKFVNKIEEKECAVVLIGENTTDDEAAQIENLLYDEFEDIEWSLIKGNQQVSNIIIGLN